VKVGRKGEEGSGDRAARQLGLHDRAALHFQLMRGPLPFVAFDNVPWEIDHFTLIGIATVDGVVSDPAAGTSHQRAPAGHTVTQQHS